MLIEATSVGDERGARPDDTGDTLAREGVQRDGAAHVKCRKITG